MVTSLLKKSPCAFKEGIRHTPLPLFSVNPPSPDVAADSGYVGPKLQDAPQELGVSELRDRARAQGICGLITSLGSGADVCVAGVLLSSCQERREDGGKFSGLGEAGRMPVQDATRRVARRQKTTYVFGNRRLMT